MRTITLSDDAFRYAKHLINEGILKHKASGEIIEELQKELQ